MRTYMVQRSQTGRMIILMKTSGEVIHHQNMGCHQTMNVIATSQLEIMVLYVTYSCMYNYVP